MFPMHRHLAIVSAAFTWTGAILGLPSFAALLYLLYGLLTARLPPPPADTAGQADYGSLVGLLVSGARLAGKAAFFVLAGLEWAMVALALAAGLLVLVAVALLAIGRGLDAHQMWARTLGILLASGAWLGGASTALSVRKGPAIAAALALTAACTYVLWALWRRFD